MKAITHVSTRGRSACLIRGLDAVIVLSLSDCLTSAVQFEVTLVVFPDMLECTRIRAMRDVPKCYAPCAKMQFLVLASNQSREL
jgi:hypothetical protein